MGLKRNLSETSAYYPFKGLKELMKNRGFLPTVKNIRKHEEISDEEIFSSAMKDVREIREFRKLPVYQKKPMPLHRNDTDRDALGTLDDIVKGRKPIKLPDTQEYVEWVNPDCFSDIAKRLHEGEFSVQDCLDLHGYTVEEAGAEVERFLKNSLKNGFGCVKIIHGRGLRSPKGPALKNVLIQWLSGRYRKNVMAFVTARQCDGGLGAVFVLLKKV